MRGIEVLTKDGKLFEVHGIPDDAKITFGALNPGSKGTGGYDSFSLTLRIYRGAQANGNQIAVFRNVESFRDLSLTIKEIGVKPKKTWIDDEIVAPSPKGF